MAVWALNAVFSAKRERAARQREEFSKAFAVCVAYEEFPYIVRRRRRDVPEEERVRISTELSRVQERLGYYSVWLAIESRRVSNAYDNLVAKLREIAGTEIRNAWLAAPIDRDSEMNMPDLGLSALRPFKEAYLAEVSDHLSVIPGYVRRLSRRIRHRGQAKA
ncbi:MAG: hypothetical protein Q8P50_11320 [Bacillota bacterium]|nr:hypothetical protein [Bacillota bacterium]